MDAPTDSKPVHPKPTKDQLYVKIYAPFKSYYDGIAKNVSATNKTGRFDVLARHHNFITILERGSITVRDDQGEHVIENDPAVMHVKGNEVIVFLNV